MSPTTRGPVPGLSRALARAGAGKSLDRAETTVLLQARADDLDQLCRIASDIRDLGLRAAGREGVVTYSRKVFVPLTRLCRDRCHYCTFATTPGRVPEPFLSPDQVLQIARDGAAAGCKEALFTLGDRPEDRWPAARTWLDERGYDSTLAYLRAMAILVLEETGLLPHLNPGVMTWQEMQHLKPVAPSMGMMLETTATRLWNEPGGCHYGSPDKEPAVRLRVLEDASRSAIPFTTGVLIGIGETHAERADAYFELRRIARQFGAIQEVIVQNFRAKPDTAMRSAPDADFEEYLAAVATARVVLGPRMRIQVPPNLSDPVGFSRLLGAGVDDWGGVSPVTPDHVNPERPWPEISRLADLSAAAGFELRERLTVHPQYALAGDPWLDPRVVAHVRALTDPESGLARPDAPARGIPWQESDVHWESTGRTDLHTSIDTDGRRTEARSDFEDAYGDWGVLREQVRDRLTAWGGAPASVAGGHLDRAVLAALRAAERDPAGLDDAQALALITADGPALDAVCELADGLRRDVVGEPVTYVVNRNINFTNICYTGCRFCAFAQRESDADAYSLSLDEVGDRAAEAWAAGATEVCMQGGIDPKLPGTAYFELVAEIRRQTPDMHVHAFSPMEIVNGSAKTGMSVREWLTEARAAGLDTIPGTAAEILDDEIRWILTKGKLPAQDWIDVVRTAHDVGLRSSATMMYGHVDEPRHWVAHLKVLARLQRETGGFTEFVPLPFIHQNAPVYLAGAARPGPSQRDNRAVHAVARLLLHGAIDNIQCSWVKLGEDGCRDVLRGGVNDLGGTLMEETISRMAGSSFGSLKTIEELHRIAALAGRPAAQRTTTYAPVSPERAEAALGFDTYTRQLIPLTTS